LSREAIRILRNYSRAFGGGKDVTILSAFQVYSNCVTAPMSLSAIEMPALCFINSSIYRRLMGRSYSQICARNPTFDSIGGWQEEEN